jgi:O-antigen/teichoic acid export membrane protein
MTKPEKLVATKPEIDPQHSSPAFTVIASANLLANGISLATGMFLVRQFTPDQYGQLTLLLASFGIFRLLATFGMGNRITIDVARSLSSDQSTSINRAFFSLLLLRGFIATILFMIAIALYYVSNQTYAIVAILLLLASFSDFNLAALQGGSRPLLVAIGIIAQPFSYAFFAVGFTIIFRSLHAVYIGLIISYALSMLVGVILVRLLGLGFPKRNDFSLSYVKEAAGFVGTAFILVILQYVFTIISVYILGISSHYAQAARLGVVMNLAYFPTSLLQIPTAAVYQARFVRIHDQDGMAASAAYLSWFLLWVFRFCMGAMAISAVFARPIVELLFGQQYLNSVPAFIFLTPLMILAVWQNVLIFTFMGLNEHKHAIMPLLVQLVLTTVFSVLVVNSKVENILLIAGLQVISIGFGTILLFQKSSHLISVNWDWREYGITVGVALFSALVIKLISFWIPKALFWNLMEMVFAVCIYLFIMRKKIWGVSIDHSISHFFRRRLGESRN